MRKMNPIAGIAAAVVIMLAISQVSPAQAATIGRSWVGCSKTFAAGKIETPARYVQATVTLASDLTKQLDSSVVRVRPDGSYRLALAYPAQARGTRLIVAIGEWDGTKYLKPATLMCADCAGR